MLVRHLGILLEKYLFCQKKKLRNYLSILFYYVRIVHFWFGFFCYFCIIGKIKYTNGITNKKRVPQHGLFWVALRHSDFHPHLGWTVILKPQPELRDKNKIFTIWENTHVHSFYPNMTGVILTLPGDHFGHPGKYWDPVICFNNQERGREWTRRGFFQCPGKCGKWGWRNGTDGAVGRSGNQE